MQSPGLACGRYQMEGVKLVMKRLVLTGTMILALAATSAFAASTKKAGMSLKPARLTATQTTNNTTPKTSSSKSSSKKKHHRRARSHSAAKGGTTRKS